MTPLERLFVAEKIASIAVDLDGTLAHQDPDKPFDPEFIGEPIPRMLSRVKRWLKDGEDVKLFTARAADPKNIPIIRKWLRKYGLTGMEITNEKDPSMEKFYDDRAVSVEPNTGRIRSLRSHT
jgi:hypothetical protein